MELTEFRDDFLEGVRGRVSNHSITSDSAFVYEVSDRLSEAEEFQDFIPCKYSGTGLRNRTIRVDGFEFDEADNSLRVLIADFSGNSSLETVTRTRVDQIFGQLRGFFEFCFAGGFESIENVDEVDSQVLSFANLVKASKGSISRYRFYLVTDSVMSDRIKDLPEDEIDGVVVEYHVWDISRLFNVGISALGTEELEIDFTEFKGNGLSCLPASKSKDFDAYMCVIPGEILASIYEKYGSRLLEGNVRSFLNATGKINKGIQGTIRSAPDRFFIYNNGISATATDVKLDMADGGHRITSARYLQIVNGGQTTASLFLALKKDKADLSKISVQMKLTVVKARDSDTLGNMIQDIAKFSNKQNKVSDSDFFSNHPFHMGYERLSRRVLAPAVAGAQFNTYWFYERAKGQYLNEQSKMTVKQKKDYQREHPRSQLVLKTDLAKSENSWRMLPHIVSLGAQKNFSGDKPGTFARYIDDEWGSDGAKFINDAFYRDSISRIIVFKFVERMVSDADWYKGGYRAQIVTYTIAKFASMIKEYSPGSVVNFKQIWNIQSVSSAMANQLERVAQVVSESINNTPVENMDVGEWCKKTDCWNSVQQAAIELSIEFKKELLGSEETQKIMKEGIAQGKLDAKINAVIAVITQGENYWRKLHEWSRQFSPLYGRDETLVIAASRKGWMPSDRQAKELLRIQGEMIEFGFTAK
jgi:hypothetical protein